NSGDATAGFWFFRNSIGQSTTVSGNGTGAFTGTHADGDILLVSDFTIGGSTSTVKVFRWTKNANDPTGSNADATGSLVALNNGNPISGDTFATVNSGPTPVPWPYTNKSGATSPDHGEFLEEGVDLTALGLEGCFSAFLAETRSSQSPTATLSDFVVGNFPLCSIKAAPGSQGLSKFDVETGHGDDSTYTLAVTNTGVHALFPQNVTDTLLGNLMVNGVVQAPSGAVTSISVNSAVLNPDGSLAPNATLIFTVHRTVQATDPNPTTSLTTFVFNEAADFSGEQIKDSTPSTGPNTVVLFSPSATLTVTASPTQAQHLGDLITYTYTVTNTSTNPVTGQIPNLVLDTNDPNNSLTDSLLGNLEADAIHAFTNNNSATVA